jgi:hypothetical protein
VCWIREKNMMMKCHEKKTGQKLSNLSWTSFGCFLQTEKVLFGYFGAIVFAVSVQSCW